MDTWYLKDVDDKICQKLQGNVHVYKQLPQILYM